MRSLAAEFHNTLISLRLLAEGGGDEAREAENLGGAHDEIVCLLKWFVWDDIEEMLCRIG